MGRVLELHIRVVIFCSTIGMRLRIVIMYRAFIGDMPNTIYRLWILTVTFGDADAVKKIRQVLL